MLRNMCANFEFPPPITEKPYQRYLKRILEKTTSECERSMLNDSSKLRHDILMGNYSEDVTVDVPISIDGSWQKRNRSTLLIVGDSTCMKSKKVE